MSMASSLEVDVDRDEAVDVDDDGDAESLTVHCSSSAIICTSREMSRTCVELHCMRALD
jgi:hypothetical protein